MVVQFNMIPKAIVEVWESTVCIFKKYKIPFVEKPLLELVEVDFLSVLLEELNHMVGSSHTTCIEGGWKVISK